jgi:Fur family ferric uptake transcriptional regulator
MPRPSHVRDAVEARLRERERHGWSIDELHDDLRSAGIDADYSSVFRAVGWLEQRGRAQRVDLCDGKARYEAVAQHHEHVQCQACGSVAVLPECWIEDASSAIEDATGFRLRAHHLVLFGLCPACQAS